ncbi:MAG: LytTR family DNA-binding domain-containing protein [bacterium]|nr:LytTR family DNA-binding domain-containing protein [bacterium]
MLHIAICDDEEKFVAYLTQLLEKFAAETGEEFKITAYYDGLQLIEKYDTSTDLIFLDIQMQTVNGLQTAESIRRMDENVDIIFLTSLTQYSLEGYRFRAADYIVKPIHYVRLKDEMTRWLQRYRRGESPFVVVSNDSGRYKIALKELRYIETSNHRLIFHTEGRDIICYRTMREIEKELTPHDFARCHSGYLVNMYFIKRIEKPDIILSTGEHIPISQPKRKEFMKRLADYWGDIL